MVAIWSVQYLFMEVLVAQKIFQSLLSDLQWHKQDWGLIWIPAPVFNKIWQLRGSHTKKAQRQQNHTDRVATLARTSLLITHTNSLLGGIEVLALRESSWLQLLVNQLTLQVGKPRTAHTQVVSLWPWIWNQAVTRKDTDVVCSKRQGITLAENVFCFPMWIYTPVGLCPSLMHHW